MPYKKKQAPEKDQWKEQEKAKHAETEKRARELDADPELPGVEPDNLIVVEDGRETETQAPYTHPKLRISMAQLLGMGRQELIAVGRDRGYWLSIGRVSMWPDATLREAFWASQSQDTTLHDAP